MIKKGYSKCGADEPEAQNIERVFLPVRTKYVKMRVLVLFASS